MLNVVGTKGQVVISKDARERLGIKPGWLAIQRVVDDHLEVRFVPPEHDESLAGVLAPFLKTTMDSGKDFLEVREAASANAVGTRAKRRRSRP